MKAIQLSAVLFAIATVPFAALADRDDDGDHGKHRHGRHEYKHEYWDGNCKVEIKQKKNGDYKEERKCRAPQHVYVPAPVYVVPQPVVVAPQPVYVQEPSVSIRATIPIR